MTILLHTISIKCRFDIRAQVDQLRYEPFDVFVEYPVMTTEARIAEITTNDKV